MAGGPMDLRNHWSTPHARAIAGGLIDLWNHWPIQILVLLSLTLQVVLLVFAGIRRHEGHPRVLTILLWSAYLLADSTAIYALGYISLSSALHEHRLVAFWAPFLLLHLGGPDSITAYALQDNQLWLRHLQNLVVQVLGAAYVLYKHIAGNGFLVLVATILMFTVGVVKYGERTLALRCGDMDNIRSSLKKELPFKHDHLQPLDQLEATHKEEILVRHAHSLFRTCKRAIVDSWVEEDSKNHYAEKIQDLKKAGYKIMWPLMEIELSLLYDILYTKASVIHTWFGYCIRLLSPLAAAASFLLFHFSAKNGHSGVDIAVTYVLLSGAFLLETTSLLGAFASTWTYAFLCATQWNWLRYTALCTGRWDRFRRLVKAVTGSYESKRRWSGKMGQYNMLHFCTRRDTLTSTLAKMVGLKEWWNKMHYSGTVPISDDLKQILFEYIKQLHEDNEINTQGVIRKNWGQQALEDVNLYEDNKYLLGAELQEGIIIWHIGTDVFLAQPSVAKDKDVEQEVKAVRVLSNYMMFLLVKRPYMLPGLAQNRLYRQTCKNLTELWSQPKNPSASRRPSWNICTMLKELFGLHDDPNTSNTSRQLQRDGLAKILYDERPPYSTAVPRLYYANKVTKILLQKEEEKTTAGLQLALSLWKDFLFYASNRCSRENHAKKLSSGAELTTVLWLMADYLHQDYLNKRAAKEKAEEEAAKEKAEEEAAKEKAKEEAEV